MTYPSNSVFYRAEQASKEFLEHVSTALTGCASLLREDTSLAKTRTDLDTYTVDVFASLPVDESFRLNPKTVGVASAALVNQRRLLRGIDSGGSESSLVGMNAAATESRAIRQLIELLSLHSQQSSAEERSADAILSFQLTADRPSLDELDSEDEQVKHELSITRGDLRAAQLVHAVDLVIELTQSELVQIAEKRDVERSAGDVLQRGKAAFGVSLALNASEGPVQSLFDERRDMTYEKEVNLIELAARNRIARSVYSAPTTMRSVRPQQIIAAAHHYRLEKSGQRGGMILRSFAPLEPLLGWDWLTIEALAEIGEMVARDDYFSRLMIAAAQLRQQYPSLQLDISNGVAPTARQLIGEWFDQGQSKPTLPTMTLLREWQRVTSTKNLAYGMDSLRKIDAALHTLGWLAQMVFVASMSGTLAVEVDAVYTYETLRWANIKGQLVELTNLIQRELTLLLTERLLRALLFESSSNSGTIDRQRDRLARTVAALADEQFDTVPLFTNFEAVMMPIVDAFVPSHNVPAYKTVVRATGAALSAVALFDCRCAAMFAVAGVLARGISFDAAGMQRGINSLVFADSMHASFDVVAHVAFDLAIPTIMAHTVALAELAAREKETA